MKPSTPQLEDFRANRPVAGIRLALNDYVNLTDGTHAGDSGTVMGLEGVGPVPTYLIELDSGETVLVTEPHLQHAGES